ncbi:hypothetical protein ScPMuIL_018723 [Solemya velum]
MTSPTTISAPSYLDPIFPGGQLLDRPTALVGEQSMMADNRVGTVMLYGIPIVSLRVNDNQRLCLAQISNTLLRDFSYNEIHNRRVALGITCLQCTPIQLEILRRTGAMPVSSRRCGLITKREAERLVKSFLEQIPPPQLPENFSFRVQHGCGWGCEGLFIPSRYNSSRAKCIKCVHCAAYLSPNKFIFHYHKTPVAVYRHPDAANFNSWRRHLTLVDKDPPDNLIHAWEDVKAMFNGGCRKRFSTNSPRSSKSHRFELDKDLDSPAELETNIACTSRTFSGTRSSCDVPQQPVFSQQYNSNAHSFGNMLRSMSLPYAPWWSSMQSYRQNVFNAQTTHGLTGQNFAQRIDERPTFSREFFENGRHSNETFSAPFTPSYERKLSPMPVSSDVTRTDAPNETQTLKIAEQPSDVEVSEDDDVKANEIDMRDQDGPACWNTCDEPDQKDDDKKEEDKKNESFSEKGELMDAESGDTHVSVTDSETCLSPCEPTTEETEHQDSKCAPDKNVDTEDCPGDDESLKDMDRLREMIMVARKFRSIAENKRRELRGMIKEKSRLSLDLRHEMGRRIGILRDQFRTEINQEKRLKMFLEEKLKEAHTALSMDPGPTVTLRDPGPTVTLRDPCPTVALRDPGPTVTLRDPGPTVTLRDPGPTVTLRDPCPTVTLRDPCPTVTLRDPGPTVTLRDPGPTVTLRDPCPTVTLRDPGPTVTLRDPGPTVTLRDPCPTVTLRDPCPTVTLRDPGPTVTLRDPGPTVTLRDPGPTVTLRDPGPTVTLRDPCPTVTLRDPCPTVTLGDPCPTVTLGDPCPTVTLRDLCPTVTLRDPGPTVTLRDPGPTVTLRDPCPTVTLRDPGPTVTLRDPCSTVTLRDPGPTVTLRDPCPTVTLRDLCPTVTLRDPGPTVTLRDPCPTVTLRDPGPTVTLRDPGPTVTLRDPGPTVTLRDPCPTVTLRDPGPTVTLRDPCPTVTLRDPCPTVTLRDPCPTVTLKDPGPTVTLRDPCPTVTLGDPGPTVTLRDPGPTVTLWDPCPTVTLRDPCPTVTLRDPCPTVTLRDPGPTVTLRDPGPTVTLRDPGPTVTLRDPCPTVTLRDPGLTVTLRDPCPTVTLWDPCPTVTLRDPCPTVTLRDPCPTVTLETRVRL